MNKIRLTFVGYFKSCKSWLVVQKDLLVLASFFFFLNRILVVLCLFFAENICLHSQIEISFGRVRAPSNQAAISQEGGTIRLLRTRVRSKPSCNFSRRRQHSVASFQSTKHSVASYQSTQTRNKPLLRV